MVSDQRTFSILCRQLCIDNYHTAEELKVSFTTVLGRKSINEPEDDTSLCVTEKPKRQTAKCTQLVYCEDCQTQNERFLSTYEELEAAEMETA
ncbi:unnamed protein product [Schistosoma margrebowiei]|uniref:Uncharacterized protein n=1 Tax=Schistosoma margrebowiei TaxID=48269 RepID=A0A183M2A6_9TREM|nr:unnamed protein product [Schistosoma margrebowiei]